MLEDLARLSDDHAEIQALLADLAEQRDAFRQRRPVNPFRLHATSNELVRFLENDHHPREEELIARLVARKPQMATSAILLVDEHRECERHARHLAEAAARFGRSADTRYGGYRLLADVVDRALIFMRLEEVSIYPMIERTLGHPQEQACTGQIPALRIVS